ncbi:hypothetical protein [Piscinibacter sp. HJYY11]|uniref:hypothetical protein n=1 Tax=Piscinibacter sp. HJYY11 TaxID=2801333 RepID=UPI00191DBD9F|nr:hypothetical protein [Piscinibacter sp. HJYY11]MBL0726567.1 hypothetical protein [Piscinibacter sp. HJYY11]
MKQTPAAPFFTGVWAGMAPLVVWAAHFAFGYVAIAVACVGAPPDPQGLRAVLLGATALAFLVLAAMLWRASSLNGHAQLMRRVGALLSLIGVAWSGVPVVLLPACVP